MGEESARSTFGGVMLLWCSLDRALAKSSACTSLLGAPSRRCSQSWGGEGGGEMKKSFPVSGRARWVSFDEELTGVSWPK